MQQFLKHILIYICMPQLILGSGCPSPQDLGARTDTDKSMCAILYEHSDDADDGSNSCTGRELQVGNGEETEQIVSGWNDVVSSLVVREGCYFVGYRDAKYQDHKVFTGTHYYLGHEHDHGYKKFNWNDEISSYVCKCDFGPLECEPEDERELLLSCDNTYDYNVTCKYFEMHGFTLGLETTQGKDLSVSIFKSLGLELAIKFAKAMTGARSTLTTGYDWSTSTEFSLSMTKTVEIDMSVPSGSHAGVYQIQGRCGDTVTKTQCYEITNMDTKEVLRSTCPALLK